MKELYPEAEDPIPHRMPKVLEKEVNIDCFDNSDHAGNRVTRRSHTGIMVFMNMAPIICFFKKQSTIESSTFGAELIALRITT